MRYVVVVNLIVEAEKEGQEGAVEKSVRGLMQQMIDNDEPPHKVTDFGIEDTMTETEWKQKAIAGD